MIKQDIQMTYLFTHESFGQCNLDVMSQPKIIFKGEN